jgi:hypothetical protein
VQRYYILSCPRRERPCRAAERRWNLASCPSILNRHGSSGVAAKIQAHVIVAGCMISYGNDTADAYRRAGLYAGRILKGAKPRDVSRLDEIALVVDLEQPRGFIAHLTAQNTRYRKACFTCVVAHVFRGVFAFGVLCLTASLVALIRMEERPLRGRN